MSLLPYPVYTMGMDPNDHVWVFCKAIQANGERNDDDIINLFCFTLHDAISKWWENFMKAHQVCRFEELEVMFCKHYWNLQMDEKVYMELWVIKQGRNEKVEV